MKSFAKSLIEWIVRIEKAIAFAAFVLMLGALAADVIGREVFGHGVFGAVKFAVYVLIYCAMAGFGIATATGSHLRPKFLDDAIPASLSSVAVRLGQFASAAILLTLAWAGLTFVESGMLLEERDVTLDVLIWPVQMAIPIGFSLSGLRHIIYGIWPDLLPAESAVAE
ncbi:TRAP transporter small permease [Sedimentitalea sp. XS_ASV28]|uniref:TRAP transporter small permease n=1 Tax=Sedimentitalea sp. XS_ASV28 TaxID=3241296 RepID=UPI0035117C34